MANPKPKPGRLNKEEKKWILDNVGVLPVEEMAEKIGKTPELVHKFVRDNGGAKRPQNEDRAVIRQDLKCSEEWERLKDEFTGKELKLFEEKYVILMAQFKGDGVLASEEMQIMQAIKYTILMSRNLMARSRALIDVQRLEDMMEDHLARHNHDPRQMDDAARSLVLNLETQLQAARASEQSHTNEYVKLQERYDNIMKSLKATRDQRVKDIQSSKVDFLGLVKSLQQKEMQDREGRSAELMRLASAKEYKRLGRLHEYEDGQVDRPILSPDTVDMEDDQ